MRLQITLLLTFTLVGCESPRRYEGDEVPAQLLSVGLALEAYKSKIGEYPPSGKIGLIQLQEQGYFGSDRYLQDEWKRDLVYRRVEDRFLLYSKGKDGIDDLGKGDDLVHLLDDYPPA